MQQGFHYKNGGYLVLILIGSFISTWQKTPSICPSPAHMCVRAHSEIHFYTFLKIHINARGRMPVCQTAEVSCRKSRRECRSHITFYNKARISTICNQQLTTSFCCLLCVYSTRGSSPRQGSPLCHYMDMASYRLHRLY